MTDQIIIDSETYVSSKRASELMDYTQDYIGQLSRGNQIKARRVGGLWYVSVDSLQKYKVLADSYHPEPPVQDQSREPESLISFDGKDYISAARAAKITGYTPDYVGQLARAQSIMGRQVGNRWYVERTGILAHKKDKDAMLGAVQTDSVGLKHKELERKRLASISYSGAGPFLDYTKDERELMPGTNEKSDLSAYPAQADIEDVESEKYELAIPIHVMPSLPVSSEDYEYSRAGRMPIPISRNAYSLLFPVVITIVIVLSLGFVSLKSSSIYTHKDSVNSINSGVQTASTVSAAGATTSTVGVFINDVGGTLERLLVPEIVYRR